MIRKIVYTKWFYFLNVAILSMFYKRKYLKGKYFETQRYGLVWAWKGLFRRVFTLNKGVRWPIGKNVLVPNGSNIIFDQSSINVFQSPGCYFQSQIGKIFIGKNVYIAPNVGLITSNHDPKNLDKHLEGKNIHIGDECWIGMNAVLLPGVQLGSKTIVGAGSVVTKSFVAGNCIIAGNPAVKIKDL